MVLLGWISINTAWNSLFNMIQCCKLLLNYGYCSENTKGWYISSLGMNQRSQASSGQWRRAVYLTLVSLVQTKYLPSGDTLFVPGSLTTEHRTHNTQSAHKKAACAQTPKHITKEKILNVPSAFVNIQIHALSHMGYILLYIRHQEIQKLDADWHSRVCINIPVMLCYFVHCPWATN